ncbi:MAG: nitroreductase family deazaflavin-dependent oxidoreductase [Thermomicrobiales bacterium]|nr:nitroreductase family deazaflavin-dependent oxidoreductase [Thermomicrobiales bacterium]MCO5219164.1 nitroreductase family deazaflavin-dependent oxidoreductase [Thermomicrobiales bacterium]MCO5225852.1 nitroreductase family deazaflavin-dependent oxidoreductase [Thermomicrobiales bacterium]MCO5228078.1 nitroreductase family deazaflavin-dependent oxidoreductase [Thermomicrobiales bacterium]
MTDTANWLAQHASEAFTYLTTTGRKSGQPHRIEIWFGADQDRMFLMAGGRDRSDWVRNLISNPSVAVELGGETRPGVAYVIHEDSPDDGFVRDLLVDKYGSDRDLADWKKRSLPVVITFKEVED